MEKQGSKDIAAIGQVSVTAGDRSDVYSFCLVAPKGNFAKAQEYRVASNLNVVKTNSWWSCLKKRLRRKCARKCVVSLITCAATGSWVGYILCVAKQCGACFAKYSAGCGCNCRWWCRWAIGCCRKQYIKIRGRSFHVSQLACRNVDHRYDIRLGRLRCFLLHWVRI